MRITIVILLLAGATLSDPLAAELARAVDLPTPKERRAAARKLARRGDVGLANWITVCRTFGTFEAGKPGATTTRMPLQVERKVEDTEITVYLPKQYDPRRPTPLLLGLHSTGGNGRGLYMNWRGTADKLGMIILCPSEAGPNVGYAFTSRERESTLAALRWARRRYNIDEDRICMAGFRRGGHLVWDLALRRRDRFASVSVSNGAPCMVVANAANNLRYLENVVDLPIRDIQGVAGTRPRLLDTVPPVFERLAAFGAKDARLIEREAVGREQRATLDDWPAFYGKARRDPRPKRIVRMYARPGEGRAFWLEILAAKSKVKEEFRMVATQAEARGMDDLGYLRFQQRKADERTARLEVVWDGAAKFVAKGTHVRKFRLLLDESMCPKESGGEVTVVFNGAEYRRKLRPSAELLLTEFVEAFDRTFLPVAEVRIP